METRPKAFKPNIKLAGKETLTVLNAFQAKFDRAMPNNPNPNDWKSVLPEWVEKNHPQFDWIEMDTNPDQWFARIRDDLTGGIMTNWPQHHVPIGFIR